MKYPNVAFNHSTITAFSSLAHGGLVAPAAALDGLRILSAQLALLSWWSSVVENGI